MSKRHPKEYDEKTSRKRLYLDIKGASQKHYLNIKSTSQVEFLEEVKDRSKGLAVHCTCLKVISAPCV